MDMDRRSFCRGLLALGLLSGVISRADTAFAAAEASKGNVDFFLSKGLDFFDGTTVTSIRPTDVQRLLDTPLHFPDWLSNGLQLTGPNDETVHVRTCREYKDVLDRGFYALTNADIKSSYYLDIPLGILEAVRTATPASASHISNLHMGNSILRYLPAETAIVFPDTEVPSNALTVQDLVDQGLATCHSDPASRGTVSFEYSGAGTLLIELMRADFNGDGIEDMLVYDYSYATEGTFGGGGTRVYTRMTPDGLLTPLPDPFRSDAMV